MVKTGTGFPESQWNFHSWKYSELGWTGPWAAGFKFEASNTFISRLGCRHPDIASNLNCSLSLWNSSSLLQHESATPCISWGYLTCMISLRNKELSLWSSSGDEKLEALAEKRYVEILGLIWSYIMQTQSQHEGGNFSNSAKLIQLGVGEFLLSLMGSLCVCLC